MVFAEAMWPQASLWYVLQLCVLPEHSQTKQQDSAMSKILKRMRLKRWTEKDGGLHLDVSNAH